MVYIDRYTAFINKVQVVDNKGLLPENVPDVSLFLLS